MDRTVVRGGYGVFFDVQEGNEAQFMRNNAPFFFVQRTPIFTVLEKGSEDDCVPSFTI